MYQLAIGQLKIDAAPWKKSTISFIFPARCIARELGRAEPAVDDLCRGMPLATIALTYMPILVKCSMTFI
ncbi:hypothetical protein [Agrobacterium salinitolerans]|uniref:hypothetical protein n=1 Tax=Agrobacterium salinitolerans TaxID=1183413 RepID=UPI0022B84E1C|nr:hypothetical protein [Agrobacterium salinitolerans]MCZ7888945.1 hypothetical protein [Agrobacterium salinitolerans]